VHQIDATDRTPLADDENLRRESLVRRTFSLRLPTTRDHAHTPQRCENKIDMSSQLILRRSANQARKAALALRGGGGGPLARPEVPSQPLAEQDELTWDCGTAYPEPCLDEYNQVTASYALKWLAGGMASFAALGVLTTVTNPASRRPYRLEKNLVYVPDVSTGADLIMDE
jgi:hypothetical protein